MWERGKGEHLGQLVGLGLIAGLIAFLSAYSQQRVEDSGWHYPYNSTTIEKHGLFEKVLLIPFPGRLLSFSTQPNLRTNPSASHPRDVGFWIFHSNFIRHVSFRTTSACFRHTFFSYSLNSPFPPGTNRHLFSAI